MADVTAKAARDGCAVIRRGMEGVGWSEAAFAWWYSTNVTLRGPT